MQSLLQMVGTLLVTATTTLATLGGGVGIGTTTISELLTVNGNIHVVSSTAGVVFPDGTKQTTAATNLPVPIVGGGTATSTVPGNGRILIGNGTDYSLNTLTAGTSTVITNTAGKVKISSNITEKFRAYLGTNQTIPGNIITKVSIDTEKFDPLDMFSTSTNEFTAPSSGYYLFIGQGAFNNGYDNGMMGISFLRNGSDRFELNAQRQPGTNDGKIQATDLEYLDAGDTVVLEFTSSNGTTTLNSGSINTFFAVHKLSE